MCGRTPDATPDRARVLLPWWAWIALTSAAFVYATGSSWFSWLAPTWPRVHAVLGHIRPWMDLDVENNLGVWWSGALLFLGSMLMFEVAVGGPVEARRPFAILGLLSLGVCLDEVMSIHERLSNRWGWSPLILIGLGAAGLLGWALYALARRLRRRRATLLVLAGYLSYGSIAIQEAAEHGKLGAWGWWSSGRLEEGSELLGSLLVLLAAVGERYRARETLSLAKTSAGGQVVDLSVLIQPLSRLDDHPRTPPASTSPLPHWRPPPARPRELGLAAATRRLQAYGHPALITPN